jgi:phage gp46-like protein
MRIIPLTPAREPSLAPDLVWDGVMGDIAPAGPDEPSNRGGLRAVAHLETAVLICLMTDARADAEELRSGDVNRGWPGDTFDLDRSAGEAPIGSKLWLLMRRTVDDEIVPRLAEAYAIEALHPLISQGAAAQITARATARPAQNCIDLAVTLTDRVGGVIVAPNFSILWSELNGIRVHS